MTAQPDPNQFEHLHSAATEVERALIGTCMMTPHALSTAGGLVQPEHFSEAVHGLMWRAMTDIMAEGCLPNPVTLQARLGNIELAKELRLREYIAHCAADTHCPPAYVPEFARQVRSFWALRQIAVGCEEARGYALTPGAEPRAIVSDLVHSLDELRAVVDGKGGQHRTIGEATASLVERMNNKLVGEIIDGAVSTGLVDLDRKLGGGFKPGELIIIAGRPGMGKSLVATSCARQMAQAGHAGGLFSLEMPEAQVSARLLSDELYGSGNVVTGGQIIQAHLTDPEAERVILAQRHLASLPLMIDDSSGLTVAEVGARARTWANRFARVGKKLEFVVIDYLKFLRSSERYRGQRHYEVGEITAGLKALAKDLGIAVVLLVQLNREVEKRAEKRPELADLRESGDIEADADVVMLLYRQAYYLANDPNADPSLLDEVKNKLEIIIAKQRMGATGNLDVFCHPGASAVRDLARR
jgi:replicative DNA helicase